MLHWSPSSQLRVPARHSSKRRDLGGGWVVGGGREGGGLEGGWGGCCVSGIKVQLSTHKLNLTTSPSPLVSLHALSPPSSFSFFFFLQCHC